MAALDKLTYPDSIEKPQDLVSELNNPIGQKINPQEPDRKFTVSGIRVHLWKALAPEQIDIDGNIIDTAFLEGLQKEIGKETEASLERDRQKHRELDDLIDKIDREFNIEETISNTLAGL